MALLDEVAEEIMKQRTVVPDAPAGAVEEGKPKRKKREMTSEEKEAYIRRKQAEEEARYLGEPKKRKRRSKQEKPKADEKPKERVKKRRRKRKSVQEEPVKRVRRSKSAQFPKQLSPLEPLYLLKIPGLPDGDCIAICYARGAVQ